MRNAERLLWTSPSLFEGAEAHFYGALAHSASHDAAPPEQAIVHLEALRSHYKLLETWAANCPENFENRAALLGAEMARIEGRVLDAERLYEKAIRSAQTHGFVHNEAVANELAGRFYLARGFDRFANICLRDARYCYQRWGADGKVAQLERLYPEIKTESPLADPTSTIVASVEHLDLATVIKVSEAVSGEIVLEKLVDTLMRTALEYAGAERGVMVLPRGDGFRIVADVSTKIQELKVELRESVMTTADLPESVFRYVVRTKESVVLHDASNEAPFSSDDYVRSHRARSVLCIPILKQAKLLGILYLENKLTVHAFTPARVTILKLLASEAASSMENAHLYRDLAEREGRIRRLVDANIIGIIILDVEGRILEANEAFLRLVRYDRDDLASQAVSWADMTPPEWRERDQQHLVPELKVAGKLQPFEKELFRKDGSRVPVLVGVANFEEDGAQGVAFVLDLSELKRAEAELRRAYDSLADAQRLSKTCSFTTDFLAEAHDWSDETFRIFEFAPGTKVSMGMVRRSIHPDDLLSFDAEVARGLSGGDVKFAFRVVTKRGAVKHVRGGARIVGQAGGRPRLLCSIQDVTENVVAEEALNKARSELTRVSRVTTLGSLTAAIAHEINQPLAGIITNATTSLRMLEGDAPDVEGARDTAKRTLRDGKRAADAIGRLRALFTKKAFTPESVDLNDAVQELLALCSGELQSSRVVVQAVLADDLPAVKGDRIELQQVIMNLLRNGSEAMAAVNDRPRQLLIRTEREGTDRVRVTVQDGGIGIDSESMDRLFEAFYTTKSEGMGIGLSISHSIIDRHHGRLWAVANDGPGATFAFSIPLNPSVG